MKFDGGHKGYEMNETDEPIGRTSGGKLYGDSTERI